jgi:lysophospholipase L1-like esterase
MLMRWPKFAACLLVLALADFTWGVGSFALSRGDSRLDLLPPIVAEPARFEWHPLLQAVPIPSLHIRSSTGLDIRHTSQRTRGAEPVPADIAGHTVVAVYGGSTTYDIAVSTGDTWGERLADALGRDRFFVVNNGVPGYTTAEHIIHTSFYQEKFGRRPDCEVYYVGWNDVRNSHIRGLDPGYADFHMPSQIDSLQLRRVGGSRRTFSPILTLIGRVAGNEVDLIRYRNDPSTMPVGSGPDPDLNAIFERNLRTISAINRGRGVKTIFAGQLVNRAALTGDGQYGWLPLVRDRDVWPMLEGLRGVLAKVATETGDKSVNLSPDMFAAADFADNGHFSPAGARKFAAALAPVVREACR